MEKQELRAKDLKRVQTKLADVTRYWASYMNEHEQIKRTKLSELRVITANTALAKSRIAAMQKLVGRDKQE